jgi:hypothetical protein
MQSALLSLALPLLVGPITFAIMQVLKTASAKVDALPSVAKRFAVAAIAVALTFGAKAAGVDLHCDLSTDANCLTALDQDTVKALVGAALAFGMHFLKPKKDA